MIKCPACSTENADGSNFCIACGIDLTATATEERVRTDSVAPPAPDTPPMTSPSVDMPREYLDNTPPPPRPAYTPPPPVYNATPTYTPSSNPQVKPAKDRTLAIVLEVIGGLFGFLGIGWLYAGNTTGGILWMVGFWIGNIIALVLDFVTVGLFTCIHVPLAIAALPLSAFLLYNYTKQHPEVFGP